MEKEIFNINQNELTYGRGYVYSLGSSFICDENLILRLPDDECIESEWFVKAEELA